MAKNGKKRPAATGGEKPKACYVLSLSVENVRCFGPKQTLDLSDGKGHHSPWTIILGENGTGKTTLLQLMVGFEEQPWNPSLRIEDAKDEDLDPRMFRRMSPEYWLRRGRDPRHESEVILGYTDSALSGFGPEGKRYEATISIRDAGGGYEYSRSPPVFVAYGASRRLGRPRLSEEEPDDAVGSLFSDVASLRNVTDWLVLLDYGASLKNGKHEQHRHRLELVTKLLTSGVLPGVTDIRFKVKGEAYPTAVVELLTLDGWIPIRQLAYGYQTAIAWMLDFVSRMFERYPDYSDPLKEPAICVVDEIDLHLHPAWQRKLIGFLSERFPNTQFIATAHSPLVVQAAENANIAVLKREGDHVVIHNDVDDIRNWRVDQILTSDLFGLESARSPEVEKLFARNEELLAKTKLTAAEKRELKELEQKIEALPTWANPGERRDLATIKAILERLDKSPK